LPNVLRSPLHFCSAVGFDISTRAYLEMGYNPNVLAQPSGQTALHLAAAGGQLDTIKLLLDWGADLEFPTFTTGRTPLHIAAFRGRLDICGFLIEAGASLKATDRQSQSSLQIAASNGYVDICKLLVEKGADVNVRDCQGRTALDLALAGKHDKVVGLLLGVEVGRMSLAEQMASNETRNDTGASPALPESITATAGEHIDQTHSSDTEEWVSVDVESEGDSTLEET
jgi:ankyrin repeat protein